MAAAVLAASSLAGCSGQGAAGVSASPSTSAPRQVSLTVHVPAGMTQISVPSSAPEQGVAYDIAMYSGGGCDLRVARMTLPKSDGNSDEDATYNLVGAVMKGSGITSFSTEGVMVPGTPGPVPTLTASGTSSALDLRVLARTSNESLQGFEVVYGCPKGKLVASRWKAIVASVRVDGFAGPLNEH